MGTDFINEVKRISGLTDAERRLLAEMRPAVEKHTPAIVEAFYANLEQNERTRAILHAEPGRIAKLKGHLTRWLVSLTEGEYGQAYFDRRYRIGYRHVEVGLEPRYVIAAMAFCRAEAVQAIIAAEYAGDAQKEARARALNKVMDIDLNIMLQSYDDKRVQQFLEVTGFSAELFENLISGEV
jgi:hypothetical protein